MFAEKKRWLTERCRLDHFAILTDGGLVLWQKSFVRQSSSSSAPAAPVDALVQQALIAGDVGSAAAAGSRASAGDGDAIVGTHACRFARDNERALVFVACYQRILHLAYVNELVSAVQRAFVAAYADAIDAVTACARGKSQPGARLSWTSLFDGWDIAFAKILRQCEQAAPRQQRTPARSLPSTPAPAKADDSPATSTSLSLLTRIARAADTSLAAPSRSPAVSDALDAETIARNVAALRARQKASGRKGTGSPGSASDADSDGDASGRKKRAPKKQARKWDDSSITADDLASFDYSGETGADEATARNADHLVSKDAMGTRSKDGLYDVADYGAQNGSEDDKDEAVAPTGMLSSLFSKLSLTSKTLTKDDIAPSLATMKSHLLSKNVASDTADQICAGVASSLEGRRVGGIGGTSAKAELRSAMDEALTRILTPKTSTDILLDISRKRAAARERTPYAITFVGVNGVGKSTNLSKVAFWLLQNRLRVLIAACDTFRSGAVEQLRVHVRNLGSVAESGGSLSSEVNMIELYERGYGKDAAGIAKDALAYGKEKGFDVVLIDTAGRMQDNEPLMRALAKVRRAARVCELLC